MKRITKKNQVSGQYERAETAMPFQILQRLGEYEDAEEQGLLVKLPCKAGDKTYVIGTNCVDSPHPERMCFCMGKSCEKCDKHFMQAWENTHHTNCVASIIAHTFSINIILTEDEALQALKVLKNKGDES